MELVSSVSIFIYYCFRADLGPDIDEKSLQYAKQNVEDNNFQQRIKLLQTKVNGPLLPLDELGLQRYGMRLSFVVSANRIEASTSPCATHPSTPPKPKCSP